MCSPRGSLWELQDCILGRFLEASVAPAGHSERAAGGGEVAAFLPLLSRVDRRSDLQVMTSVVAMQTCCPCHRQVLLECATVPSATVVWTTLAPAQPGLILFGADFCHSLRSEPREGIWSI